MAKNKLVKVIKVSDEMRDYIQLLWLDYHQKENVIKGYLDDHRFDDDASFIDSPIFKAYEDKCARALLEYELAQSKVEKEYKPKEFNNLTAKWELDYNTCEITFTEI